MEPQPTNEPRTSNDPHTPDTTTAPHTPQPPAKRHKRLRRRQKGTLNATDYFMLGFGSMVGVGWTVSSNHWLAQAGGPWTAFIGFIIGTLLLIPIGLTYGELMAALPVSGGVMSYSYRAFGSPVAFFSSWFLALAYLTILPWEAIYINRILSRLFPALSAGPILYTLNQTPIYLRGVLLGIALALALFAINIRGSKLAARIQTLFTWLIIGIGALVILLSALKLNPSNLQPLYQNIGVGKHDTPLEGILSMIVIVPFFMAGFDTISQSVEQAHPKLQFRSIARALVLAIIAAGAFYAMIILSTASVQPWSAYAHYDSPAVAIVLQQAYGRTTGDIIYTLVMIGTLAGLFSTWNGMFMAAARLLQSMGQAGLLFQGFAKEHPKYQTPVTSLLFCLAFAIIGPFVGLSWIDPLTNLGSVAFVLGWLFTCLSAYILRSKEPELHRPYRPKGGRTTLLLAVIISGIIALLTFIPGQAAFMGTTGLILFASWLALGAIFYYFTNAGTRGLTERARRRRIFPDESERRKHPRR